jgi:hypothetical protein
MKTTTATLVPLPLVPTAPGPIGLGDCLRRPSLRRLAPQLRPRTQAEALNSRDPGPKFLPPAAERPFGDARGPVTDIARLFAPETRP